MAREELGELTEGEMLALAVHREEENRRGYCAFGASLQVQVGGALVFCVGILIGSPSTATGFCRISFDVPGMAEH